MAVYNRGKVSMKIALVSSVGGHLTELLALSAAFRDCERFWVINDETPIHLPEDRVYRICHSERDWKVLRNLAEFAAIFSRERPDAMLSTGAGLAVPGAIVARAAGIPVMYIEATCAVTRLTLTGKLIRYLADDFFVQWRSLKRVAPWARYEGSLLEEPRR
jgi:UDP-N-acetylglucosamine:LPS N-acetylglucosamine transferase